MTHRISVADCCPTDDDAVAANDAAANVPIDATAAPSTSA
eukprot:CAMPEP_0205960474 /NCGR_PEP_ID=MMETSP1459-20131121/61750_1 /ASSEMBLY_ACC=CAM_ASM_001120 /TAXON_ID=41880 /ORGANISM="Pycnococcus provasolii, Strain RCC931" /LENGTH=39 /DNA_ID= /DNA_START= /DNA_END= /DNA_ORIENTATION=